MKFVKLEPITSKAVQVVREHGDIWKVQQRIERPDPYFFQSRKPQLYLTPLPKPTRNPKEDLGDNYVPPTSYANIGARWVQESGDPDFELSEHKFGRK